MAAPGGDEQRAAVIETFEVLLEMSQLLNTGLDAQSLGLCVKLCESGVNPVALACLIKEVRAQTASNVPTSVVMERRRLVRQDYVPESKKKSANDDALSDSAGTSAQASKGTPMTMTETEKEATFKDTKPMTMTETEEEATLKDTTPMTMTETVKEATLKDTRPMTMAETEEEETVKDTTPMTMTETEEEATLKDITATDDDDDEEEATLKVTALMTMTETEEEETLKYITLSEGTLENPGIALATGLPGPRID